MNNIFICPYGELEKYKKLLPHLKVIEAEDTQKTLSCLNIRLKPSNFVGSN